MRWSSITSRGFVNRAYRVAGRNQTPARNGLVSLRAVFACCICTLIQVASLQAASIEEFFGVWVLDRSGDAANPDGKLAIWQTATGIGLTWNNLPPDRFRGTIELARGADQNRFDLVRSDPPLAAGERVEARLEPNRLVVSIVREGAADARLVQYALFIRDGRLVLDYRLRQGAITIESATQFLRRIKVIM